MRAARDVCSISSINMTRLKICIIIPVRYLRKNRIVGDEKPQIPNLVYQLVLKWECFVFGEARARHCTRFKNCATVSLKRYHSLPRRYGGQSNIVIGKL